MKIALISLNQAWEDKAKNLEKCEKLLRNASVLGADIAVFPEMTLTGYSFDMRLAEVFDDSFVLQAFSALAAKYAVAIVFGMSVRKGAKALNRLVYVNKAGEIVGFYDKIHPFSFAKEERHFEAGENLLSVNEMGANLSFSICYDLRFPELFSVVAKSTDIYINIANWPESRAEHFTALLKARAIENQAFVVGVNRIGEDNKDTKYKKSSVAYDPYGVKIKPTYTSRELDLVDIETKDIATYRSTFTSVKDKKFELYGELIAKQLQ